MAKNEQRGTVAAWEERVIIPTYPAFPPDPNPMFLEKRVNQGATGRVYPNAFTDRLSSEKVERAYQGVFLENEYVQLMLLPEIGGRIQIGMDKSNGFDFFYRQHVIKPALIGNFGSWIAGGVEFNWPQHHRPSTFMPVDHLIEEHADGSRTVWLSEHEPTERMKGMVGICLHPGKAYVELKVQLYNRTPLPQTFLWWVNIGVHVHEQYQAFFPPDVTTVTDHSKRAMEHFPIAKGFYYGVDYTKGVDIRWYKNIPVAASYFVWESRYDFFGGYDHRKQAGLVHVANHHIAPGKKTFTWGTGPFGQAWEKNLTDADGPYVELMAGAYTDNQPDFSWLQPYESKQFRQYLYPIQKIGPVQNANERAALALRMEGGHARVGVCVTETLAGATISLEAGGKAIWAEQRDLTPGAPFLEEAELGSLAETEVTLQLCDAAGREVIRYRPEKRTEGPLPEAQKPVEPPAAIETTEELYLAGLHLEQYKHPTMEPEPYWEEALRRDAGDARSHNALGLSALRRGETGRAEEHLRKAIARWTKRNPNPRDGEPYYNLGLALKYQGRLEEAYAAFYKAIWSYAWQGAGYYALAEIDGLRQDWAAGLEHLERALRANALNLKARNLKAAMLRRLGRPDEAEMVVAGTIEIDKVDYWSHSERVALARARGEAGTRKLAQELAWLMQGDGGVLEAQRYLDLAFDLAGAGLREEATDILNRLVESKGARGAIYPMVLYTLGYLAEQEGLGGEAGELYEQAAQMPPDYCFPVRLEELAILERALAVNPADARAHYYLGNALYDKKRYEEAMAHWEKASGLEPGFAIPWRNLGVAHYNVRHDGAGAVACYEKALAANPRDGRLLSELDQVSKRTGEGPKERLARLEAHLELVAERDDLTLERAALYNQLGEPGRALEIVMARHFHPWEGGEGRVSEQYVTAHVLLGERALAAGDGAGALAHFQVARHYPENLGEGQWGPGVEAHLAYREGLAHEEQGDEAGARACFEEAATETRWKSPLTYWRAKALRKLGREEEAKRALGELLEFAQQGLAEARQAGFETSVPQLIFFEEDAHKPERVYHTYLLGLARLGLGQTEEARAAFGEVLALDGNHWGAGEEMRKMG